MNFISLSALIFFGLKAQAAFDFKVGGKAIEKAEYLKLMREQYIKDWCANPKMPHRLCFEFTEAECTKTYGEAFDVCGKSKTEKYPALMRFNTMNELAPVSKSISGCMHEKVQKENAGRISKVKCPDFPAYKVN